LHRPDLAEAALPKTQHVLGNVQFVRYFADGAKGVGRFVHGRLFSLSPRLSAAVFVTAINALLQDGGWLEHHHPARRNRNFLAGLGVTADPLALFAHDERAKR